MVSTRRKDVPALFNTDRQLEHWIAGHRVGWLNWLFVGLSEIGTLGLVWLALALALALLHRRPAIVVAVLVTDGAANLITTVIKAIVGRPRPAVDRLGPAVSSPSFPSGHTSTSVACAVVLAAYAPRLRGPLYLLAALIALSRLYNGDHYPLDVAGGAVLGLATARLLLGAVRRRSHPGRRPG